MFEDNVFHLFMWRYFFACNGVTAWWLSTQRTRHRLWIVSAFWMTKIGRVKMIYSCREYVGIYVNRSWIRLIIKPQDRLQHTPNWCTSFVMNTKCWRIKKRLPHLSTPKSRPCITYKQVMHNYSSTFTVSYWENISYSSLMYPVTNVSLGHNEKNKNCKINFQTSALMLLSDKFLLFCTLQKMSTCKINFNSGLWALANQFI